MIDFHVVVNKVTGAEDLGFITMVAEAPVSRWGYRFDRLGGDKNFLELLKQCTGVATFLDANGNLRLGWPEPEMAGSALSLRSIGQVLFEALFPEGSAAYELLGRSCAVANQQGQGLRLKLELHPELSNLPWEVLRYPLTGSWTQDIGRARMSVLRYLGDINQHRMESGPAGGGRPCVLVVKADPNPLATTETTLSFFNERSRVENAFRGLSEPAGVDVEIIEIPRDRRREPWPGTLQRLIERVDDLTENRRPIIGFHFIGHGDVDDEGSFLWGEDAEGRQERIGEDELRQALDRVETLRWVILNACSAGHEPVGCPLAGLATSMSVLKNVPTVLAYKRPVETTDAEYLAGEFYDQVLGRGRRPEEVIRNLNFRLNNPGGLVLLVRSVAGRMVPIWEAVSEPPSPPERPTTRTRPRRREPARRPEATEPESMILIPKGRFQKGLTPQQVDRLLKQFQDHNLALNLDSAREALQEEKYVQEDLAAFLIDRTPVTNQQFEHFVEATGHRTEAERKGASRNWRSHNTPEKADHPVVFVTYADAEAYCRWADKRLPTADEWKKACRGPEGRLYPWGDTFDKNLCNTAESQHGNQTTPVTLLPGGASYYGCLDMVGNVEEWTSTPGRAGQRIVLGGSWCSSCEVYGLPVLHRLALPGFNSNEQGFRCAKDP